MNTDDYNKKFKEVIKNFSPEFKEKYRSEDTAHVVVDALVAGVDPYKLLEHLIEANVNLTRTAHRLMLMHPVPFDWNEASMRANIRKEQLNTKHGSDTTGNEALPSNS